jgi:HK97 gp10 family phage protein
MAKQSAIALRGFAELESALRKLPRELQNAAETTALRAGAAPIRKAAKGHLSKSKDSGLLSKALGTTVKKTRMGQKTARVGPRSGFRQVVKRKGKSKPELADPVKYAHLVEYGTSKTAARPFIRPALESSADQALSAMAAGYNKHLSRVVARLRKR